MTPTERAAVQERADRSGLLLSEYVRAAVFTRPMPAQAKHDRATLRELLAELARVGNNLNQIARVANTTETIRSEELLESSLRELTRAMQRVIQL